MPTKEASQQLALYDRSNLEMFRFAQHDKEEADSYVAALKRDEAQGLARGDRSKENDR